MDLAALFSLEGKIALVTGGTQGIGFMIAEGLVGAGARVIVCGRRQADAHEAELSLGRERCRALLVDLGEADGPARLIEGVKAETDRLHILVNNAGTGWSAALGAFPRRGFEKVLQLNLMAPFELIQQALPLLEAAASADDPARIINIASVDGLRPPLAETYSYSASKAGMLMLARHLGAHLVGRNITVNVIAPGLFETRLSAHMFDPSHPRAGDRPDIPLGRPGRAEDVAGAAIYLASRAGAYLTGVTLPVAGGIGTVDQ